MVLVIVLTIYQVLYLMPDTKPIDLVIRLFAWGVTGVLVALLMYGRKDARGSVRSPQVKTIGLAASVINLLIWAGITYWLFVTYVKPPGSM